MLGESGERTPTFLAGANAVVWARDYSTVDKSKCDCSTLEAVLKVQTKGGFSGNRSGHGQGYRCGWRSGVQVGVLVYPNVYCLTLLQRHC